MHTSIPQPSTRLPRISVTYREVVADSDWQEPEQYEYDAGISVHADNMGLDEARELAHALLELLDRVPQMLREKPSEWDGDES